MSRADAYCDGGKCFCLRLCRNVCRRKAIKRINPARRTRLVPPPPMPPPHRVMPHYALPVSFRASFRSFWGKN